VTQFPGVSDILHVDNCLGVLIPADCSRVPAGCNVRGGVPCECLWPQEFKRHGTFCPCKEETRHGRPQLFRSASDGPHRNIRECCSVCTSENFNFNFLYSGFVIGHFEFPVVITLLQLKVFSKILFI